MLRIRTKPGVIYPLPIYGTDKIRHEFGPDWTEIEESLVGDAIRTSVCVEIEVVGLCKSVPASPLAPTESPDSNPAVTPEPAPAPAEPAPEEPPPKRIVSHQGIVRSTWSIQSPTPYALVSPDTGETINYLYTSSTNLNLKRYKGLRIIVTGEEGLDSRWHNTPVITIQKIHVLE